MKNELFGFIWAHASYFYVLASLFVFCSALLFFAGKRQFMRLDAYGLKARGAKLFKHFSRPKRIAKTFLLLCALLLTSVALMRPQKDEHEETIKTEGRDWVIALDISKSMLAKDMGKEGIERLEFAKEKIRTLVNSFETDRIALILFAGSAFVYCPLTNDRSAFLSMLDTIDSQMTALGSTSLEKPIEKTFDIFEKMPEKRKNKVLVMFTDGEDFSKDLSKIKARAQKENLTIFTIGIGSDSGAPIPVYNAHNVQTGFQKDRTGSIVMSRLDEKLLRDIALRSGGKYISATTNNKDISELLHVLEKFEREGMGEKKMKRMQEFYFYFSSGAGILLLLEWLL